MKLRQFLFLMLIGTLLCWGAWFMVIFNIDPFEGSVIGFALFYLSFFLSIFGTFSLILFPFYYTFSKGAAPLYRYVQRSFSHSVIISIFLITLLFLQGLHIFTIWNFSLLTLAGVSVMAFIFSLKRSHV